jgi:hypothetical protein
VKLLITLITLLLSTTVFAESITCQITEFSADKRNQTVVTVNSENDPHGGLTTFRGELFPEISGFVSLLQRDNQFYAVLSVYSDTLATNSSGQYQMVVDGQYAQFQFIIPSESLKLAGIEIVCQFSKPAP